MIFLPFIGISKKADRFTDRDHEFGIVKLPGKFNY